MSKWKIYPMIFGWIDCPKSFLTTGLDANLIVKIPYLGYFLSNGTNKVLIDNGINSKYIVDGKAWAGLAAGGGEDYIASAFVKIGVDMSEVDTVIYTHLHNDHAGNCHLFPDAVHVFQDVEWKELLDPLPSMKIRGDFDQSLISTMKRLNCQRVVGDVEILEGLSLMLTPGHTAGSQCIIAETAKGKYLISGDTIHIRHIAYGYLNTLKTMDNNIIDVTPAPKEWDEISPSSLVYDHYAWYRSIYKIKSMFKDPDYVLTGHGPYLVHDIFG
jgi:glyoxylase-like metal-dependent hydrolase (beta-lactamase superfamily II)